MENNFYPLMSKTYHFLCLVLAIALVAWCIHEFTLDRDVTEILLRKYHDAPDDIHPSITVCYMSPFQDEKFLKYDKSHSVGVSNTLTANYKGLITGDAHQTKDVDENMFQRLEKIDYDEVTISLKEIIAEFNVKVTVNLETIDHFLYHVTNNSLVLDKTISSISKPLNGFDFVNAYVSARRPYLKCFTFDVPYEKGVEIKEVGIRLNASIFQWGLSPTQMYFTLTYPKQFLRMSLGNRIRIREKRIPQCYQFEVNVGSMEVFKRRDKESARCNVDWRNQDDKHLIYIIEKIGCNPKHWKIDSPLPNCSKVEQYYEANKEIYQQDGYMPPCRSIEKLSKTTIETELRGISCYSTPYSFLDLKFYFDEESMYKEILLVPAYTLQSLIGNAGNYIKHIGKLLVDSY